MAPFLTNFFPGQEMLSIILMINLLFFIGLPLVTVVIGVSRLAFKTRMGKGWRTGMLLLWIINTISFFAIGGILAREFAVEREMKQSLTTADFEADTVRIGLYQVEKVEDQTFHFGPGESIELPGARTYISVRPSEDAAWHLEQTTSSRGNSIDDAEELARSLELPLQMEAGSLLIPSEVPFNEIRKWRNQEIQLTLYVPEGALLTFDREAVRRTRRMKMKGEHRVWRHPEGVYQMETDGLVCVSCPQEEAEESGESENDSQFPFTDFSNLSINGKMKVEITQGDSFVIRLAGDEQYLEQVEVNMDGQDLSVSSALERSGSPIRLFITMPTLERLQATGTDDISIDGFEQGGMEIVATGDLEIKSDLRVDLLQLTLAEEADFELRDGTVGLLEATLSDRSRLDADRGAVSTAKLTLADESRAKMKQGVEVLEQTVGEDSRIRWVE